MIYDQETDGDDCWNEIAPPRITAPLNNAINVSILVPLPITVSAFIPQVAGITLVATDVEIRTAAKGGGTLVFSTSSGLSIPGLLLGLGTDYYIRARQRSAQYTSMWSDDVKITTSLV